MGTHVSDQSTPHLFAQDRVAPWSSNDLPHLAAAWSRTRETLLAIRAALDTNPLPDGVVALYVCGSMGRMEQLPESDCDLVIVTEDAIAPDSPHSGEIHAAIWRRLEPLGLHRPKPHGIFSQAVTRGQLTDRATLGVVDEDQFVFGKRIQLLLDSQPVCADAAFDTLARDVLERYVLTRSRASLLSSSPWSGLISDLTRYFHSLRIRTTWWPADQPGRWRTLNVKLRFSRLLLYAGMLALVANTASDAPLETLSDNLAWTPLERIAIAFGPNESDRDALLHSYDRFLARMGDPTALAALASDEASCDTELESFRNLIESSRDVSRLLTRWIAARDDEFLRELLFL